MFVAVVLGVMFGVLGGLGDSVRGQSANDRAVEFDVKFQANFVQGALAAGETLPDDTTFRSVAFAIHGSSASFFQEGEAASAGLKAFAETGATDLLVQEFAASPETASTYPAQATDGTFPQTAEQAQTFPLNRATRKWSNLTFVASFSESPDWFVGARNIDLRPGGVWIEELTVDLYAWDAGTDSGADFDSADSPTSPAGNVTSLKGSGKFSDMPIGTLTISMLVPPSDDRDQHVLAADANSLDGALNVFWDAYPAPFTFARSTLDTVDFDRYLVAWKSGAEEFQTELDGDRVKVVMGRESDRVILEGLTNGTEYTVRVHHANAIGPAVHHSRESTATPAARVRELVSNTSQGRVHAVPVTFVLRAGGHGWAFAWNDFTTGANPVDLGSVTFSRIQPMAVGTDQHPRNLVIELSLHEDDGARPGTRIGTFVSPPEYVDGPAKFVAPGDGFALSASTTYWLRLVLIEGEVEIPMTLFDDLDRTSQPDWDMGDICDVSNRGIWGELGSFKECWYYSTFMVSLNSPVESTLPKVSITGSSAAEGESVDFTVELSRALSASATVEYSTADGSGALPATSSDGDYTPVSGQTITFAPGETSTTISIATGDDSTDETNERFIVHLGNPSSNIVLSELDAAAGFILNNDQTTSSDSTVAGLTLTDQDGNSIALNETFDRYRLAYTADAGASVDAITLSASFNSGVRPHYLRYFDAVEKVHEGNTVADRSAEYTRLVPGTNRLRLLITSNDQSQESRYEVIVTKAASSDAAIDELRLEDAGRTALDLSPAFSASHTEYTATVDGEAPFWVDVIPNHGGADGSITLNGRTIHTYDSSSPLFAALSTTFDLEAGENTLVIELTAEDGTTKTYTFTLTRILEAKFGRGPFSVAEGSRVSIPVILDQPAPSALTIPLTAANQNGAGASDYSVPASVQFMAGDSEQSIEFLASADAETDGGERVELGFGALPSYVSAVAPTTAMVDIRDVAPSTRVVDFEQASYSVAEGGAVTVTVTLNSAASAPVDIPLTVSNQGGATGADYATVPANVRIAGGADEGSFTFRATDDAAVDPGESVRLGLGSLPSGYTEGSANEAVISIADNDQVPQVTVGFVKAAYAIPEGGRESITVVLDRDPERRFEITLSVTPVDAVQSDFEITWPAPANPGVLVFDRGVTVRAFTFTSLSDDEEDDGESVRIAIDTPAAERVALGAVSEATVTINPRPSAPSGGGGGGGGGGGPSGPSPSTVDFEWTVKHDLEALDSGNDAATGIWSDGATLWVADNPDGAGDGIYAYDLETGERVEGREFALDERNRAPRGIWSDTTTMWVSDSGRNKLFAYDLTTGERVEERDIVLAERNRDVRDVWSDETTMWVLDGRTDTLFAYALASGALLAEYALDSRNSDPQGIWSDRVTLWISDAGSSPRRLFAYRVPTLPDTPPKEALELERVREEEFEELSQASNNSPRGIWSDGDVMYVADASDGKVYTYNMPGAIDARLTSLTLEGVDIGDFAPGRTDYGGVIAEGVTETSVTAEAMQRRTDVAINPPDADDVADGHQVSLNGVTEITVTVTSADGTRTKDYRVRFSTPEVKVALEPGWNTLAWPGADGVMVAETLQEAGLSDNVVVVYRWDEAAGTWLGYFPGLEGVPGLNTLTAFSSGATYWVAASEAVSWTLGGTAADEE